MVPTKPVAKEHTIPTCDKNHSGDDVGAVRIGLLHAKRRTQDERDGHDGTDHRQVVLGTAEHTLHQSN